MYILKYILKILKQHKYHKYFSYNKLIDEFGYTKDQISDLMEELKSN